MKLLFDNFEVQKVGEWVDPYCSKNSCIPVFDKEDEKGALRTFYTVYGHLPEGGVEALIDTPIKKQAEKLCKFFNKLLTAYIKENK